MSDQFGESESQHLAVTLQKILPSIPLSILEAFRTVPRRFFIPTYYEYNSGAAGWFIRTPTSSVLTSDTSLVTKVFANKAVSESLQPSVMAAMLVALSLEPGQSVLEIGTGTGYNAALIAQLVGESGRVISVERDMYLSSVAISALYQYGDHLVQLHCMDGLSGCAFGAPYDRIISTGSVRSIPAAWIDQLSIGGVLVGCLRPGTSTIFFSAKKESNDRLTGRLLPISYNLLELRPGLDDTLPVAETLPSFDDKLVIEQDRLDFDVFSLLADHSFLVYLDMMMPYCRLVSGVDCMRLIDLSVMSQLSFYADGRVETRGTSPLLAAFQAVREDYNELSHPPHMEDYTISIYSDCFCLSLA